MTHSHDTSTPAMSAETVPSELCPKPGCGAQKIVGSPCHDWDCPQQTVNTTEHAARLTASHLAKEGGEAGARAALERIQAWVRDERANLVPVDPDFMPKHVTLKSVGKKIRDEIASLPQPSPALAKGGDAVREAAHADWLRQSVQHCSDSLAARPPGLGGPFALSAALSTPTEGPASQTEGMGGEAEAVAIPVGWFLVPEVATEEQMNAGLYQSSQDSDHASVMQSYMDMVRTPVDLPPPFAALTPPETAEAVPVAGQLEDITQRCRKAVADRIGLQVVLDETKAELAEAERERDDAVKALETAREDERDRLFSKIMEKGPFMRPEHDQAVRQFLQLERAAMPADRAAARSASSQGGEGGV